MDIHITYIPNQSIDHHVHQLYPAGGGGGCFWCWTVSRAGSGLPVPEPPQLRQGILPDPAQVRQPESPSDQRLQRHSTRPEPPHVAQRGRASHLEAAGRPSPSDRFAIARPASMPSPADAITTGATILWKASSNLIKTADRSLDVRGTEREEAREKEEGCFPWLSCVYTGESSLCGGEEKIWGRVWRRFLGRRRR